jgi:hypothetical protein
VDVLAGERRAAGGDRLAHPGLMERDGVEVAFHENHPVGPSDGLPRLRQGEEDVRFVVERRVGRVEILRRLVLRHGAPAERDDAALGVGDGDHEPVAEAVVEAAAPVARHREARPCDGLGPLPLRAEVTKQVVPAGRRVAEPEGLGRGGRDASRGEVLAHGPALRRGEPRLEEARGGSVRGEERLPLRLGPARLGRQVVGGQRDAGAAGKRAGRLREAHPLAAHEEVEGGPAGSAAEAVEETPCLVHRERRGLLLVERAEPLPPRARLLERDLLADHLDDVRPLADLPQRLLGDEGHARRV